MRKSLFILICPLYICIYATVLFSRPIPGKIVSYLQKTFGEYGNQPGQFNEPSSLTIDPRGFLYVADTGNNRIQKFDSDGNFKKEIGGFGWEKERFDHPTALSARNGLDVFISDHYNHRIERYDKDLNYLASLKNNNDWPEYLQFGFPLDVDISPQGELYCLDGENQRILKLDVLGNPQISFGDFDAGEGRLHHPRRMYISPDNYIFISDEKEGKIIVFDIHGNYLFSFGEGVLEKPAGMTGKGPDLFFVADPGNKKIFVFYKYSTVLVSISGSREDEIHFQEPVDVCLWKDRLYVLDKKRATIDIFKWNDTGIMESQ